MRKGLRRSRRSQMDSPDRPVRKTVRFRADGTLPSNNVASSSCPSLETLDSDDDEPDSITPNHTAYFCTSRKVNLSPQEPIDALSEVSVGLVPQERPSGCEDLSPKSNVTKLHKIPYTQTVSLLQCLSSAHQEALQRSHEVNADAQDAGEWINLAFARESSPLRGLLSPPPPLTSAHDYRYLHNDLSFCPSSQRQLSKLTSIQNDTPQFSTLDPFQ